MHLRSRLHFWQSLYVITISILPLIVVGAVNYLVDPLQIYRKQQFFEQKFWNNQRYQNAGKIRNYLNNDGYDSVLIGNSVSDNFIPSHVAQAIGCQKMLKLTVDGGMASEQAFMLDAALSRGSVKKVFWCTRVNTFMDTRGERWHPKYAIPFYLYTDTIWDDSQYVLSIDNFNNSLSFVFPNNSILGELDKKSKWSENLEYLNYWQNLNQIKSQIAYNSPSNIGKLQAKQVKISAKNVLESNSNFPFIEEKFVQLVKMNPNVEFYVVFAPAARADLATQKIKFLQRYFGVQKAMVQKVKNFRNITIFGFENDDFIVNNLANYRDSHHYHSGVNEYMLQVIKNKNNRLNNNNIDKYISEIIDKMSGFKIYSDFESMIPLATPEENSLLKENMN